MLQNRATLKQTRFYLLNELRQRYPENESGSVHRLILEHLGYPLSICLREPEKIAPAPIIAQINKIVDAIHSGQPVQYVLGETVFCDLSLVVNEHVLIPRQETEGLVYMILSEVHRDIQRIMDLGTGSGCIALALKHRLPDAEVTGLDVSTKALAVAAQNGRLNHLEVRWETGDLLDPASWSKSLPAKTYFDLVVSNPPYVLESEKQHMESQVLDHEPEEALFVKDEDPLIYYRAILNFCDTHLVPGGHVWMEINERFGKEVARLYEQAGYRSVEIKEDIHVKERYIHARK